MIAGRPTVAGTLRGGLRALAALAVVLAKAGSSSDLVGVVDATLRMAGGPDAGRAESPSEPRIAGRWLI